ncbi:hypothetical protein F5Y17DRAFT_456194 [Xylariaceae sp. FL0594]|nr:hypothetical protein F5Y17DRAFT_456194 [Xylariaceae sp. FL0594]
MADYSLHVGRCHYQTGQERYHLSPSAVLPWDTPAALLPPHQAGAVDLELDLPDALVPDTDSSQGDNEPPPIDDSPPSSEEAPIDVAQVPFNELTADLPGPASLVGLMADAQPDEDVQQNEVADVDADHSSEESPASEIYEIHGAEHDEIAVLASSDDDAIESSEFGEDEEDEEDEEGSDGGGGGDGDDNEDPYVDEEVPGIAKFRLNLTVLSQRYNIYGAAYRDKIHIFRVRSCIESTLSSRPSLVIRPPTSPLGVLTGGVIDGVFPHQINHMIVGELGDMEILVAAYDDGDVLAYHMLRIQNEILRREAGGLDSGGRITSQVTPFFHRNVGRSAWGLAIHPKSRMIAVGTNLFNVHVFAFALTNGGPSGGNVDGRRAPEPFMHLIRRPNGEVDVERTSPQLSPLILDYQARLNDAAGPPPNPLSSHREYNYHITLQTGPSGNNIPNVAFADDDDGNADHVVAVDITGNIWVMKIWALDRRRHCVYESIYQSYASSSSVPQRVPHAGYPPSPFGWGVLVLPDSSFMPTSTFRDSLGLDPAEAMYVYDNAYGYYIGTRRAIEHVKNNSTLHPWVRSNQRHRFRPWPVWLRDRVDRKWYDIKRNSRLEWTSAQDEAADKKLKYQPLVLTRRKQGECQPKFAIAKGITVMRTYDMAIELIGGHDQNPGIMMDYVTHQAKPRNVAVPPMTHPPERLAHLLHVPELSLVVAGSGCGRVALVTLTRPTSTRYTFSRGFKVEAILPTATDEDHEVRPLCPLLGIAFGPIPAAGPDSHLVGERRYRLMIHYYNHKILSYEVYRQPGLESWRF